MLHPRVSVSGLCSVRWSLAEDVAFWRDEGYDHVGVPIAKLADAGWDAGVDIVRDAGVRVSNVIGPGLDRLLPAIDAAAAVGAGCLVCTTGPARSTTWESAYDSFAAAFAAARERAASTGVAIAIEHTNSLRPDVGFLHTLRDAVDVARDLGVGVCVELNACWLERGVERTIADAVDVVRLVQVSDFVVGTTCTPDRAVPGDGDIPLERLIGAVLDAGYVGAFDLELLGPRIEEEGYGSAIRRSVATLSSWLDQRGA